MTEHYENIRAKTVCTECGGNDMAISYLYESSGIMKKQSKVLGMSTYVGLGNMLMIVCRKCGYINKSFAIAK